MVPIVPTSVSPTSFQVPSSNTAVSVPRSTFVPCDLLQRQLDRLDMLQDVDDFGYALFRRVCYVVGFHLQQRFNCDTNK